MQRRADSRSLVSHQRTTAERARCRGRQLRVEQLEDRRLLANLAITGLELVNWFGNPISAPAIGEMVFVKAYWSANAMAGGEQYSVRFAMDGVPLDVVNENSLPGGNSAWWRGRGGWYASPGSHTITVTVDGANSIAESNEADNAQSLVFAPTSQSPPQKLSSPVNGPWYEQFPVTNYHDTDPRSGVVRDFQSRNATYDGHDAYDISLPDFAAMDAIEPILAAADGIVVQAHDGEFDRQTTWGEPAPTANYVVIDHGQGWKTSYWHLRRDSVRVKVGDTLQRGNLLGYMGSSGVSTGAHLHFRLDHNNSPVETFYAYDDYWQTPSPGYVFDQPHIYWAQITNYDAGPHLNESPSSARVLSQAAGQKSQAIGRYSGLESGDVLRMEWWQPNNTLFTASIINVTANYSNSYFYTGLVSLPAVPMLGAWEVRFLVNGVTLKTESFVVVAGGAPEVRVETGTQIVLDGRYTPLDFGTLAIGAPAAQQTFTVTNHGSAPLELSNMSVPSNFTITEGLTNILAPGGQDTFTVSFATANPGNYAGQIRFTTNDTDEQEYTFSVEGKVKPATGVALVLGIADRQLPEGSATVANVRRRDLVNVAGAPALVVSLSVSGAGDVGIPASVTIPAGRDYVSFPIQALSDGVAEGWETIRIIATAPGYAPAENELDIENLDPLAPLVGSVATFEEVLSMPILIDRHPAQGGEVTHFKISGITAGALFKSNGTTAIPDGSFITYAEAQAGVRFLPASNSTTAGRFDVEASFDGVNVAPFTAKGTSHISVTPVGDTPRVDDITTLQGELSNAIFIQRNLADGPEVTHFKISGITGGTLFKSNGTTAIANNSFITFAEAQAGVKFLPSVAAGGVARFDVEASQNGTSVATQSLKATSTITVVAPLAVEIAEVTPDPRNAPVGSVSIRFSEAVTGVDLADFGLTRNGIAIPLSDGMLSGGGANYTLNLSGVTASEGGYELTLTALNSGIRNSLGFSIGTDATESWRMDLTLPTGVVSAITPDPRNTPVGLVTISFTEAVSGVDLTDFRLTRDGNQVALNGLVVAGSGAEYTLDLSTVTGLSGSYLFGIVASGSGIKDTAGNVLSLDATEGWVIDLISPTIDIVAVTPDPRTSDAGTISINFSEPVTGFDLEDLTLTHDGQPISFAPGSLSGDERNYVLNISGLTGASGEYVLSLSGASSGILDLAGNPLATGAVETWTADTTLFTADILDIAPDPRQTAVGLVTIQFSEVVTGVDSTDFELRRDGNVIDITAAPFAGSGAQYTLDLSAFTALPGAYVLSLVGASANIQDALGNGMFSDATDAWHMVQAQLQLSVPPGAIYENGGTVTLTVARTDLDRSEPLTVELQSNNPAAITVPAEVVIPAGAASIAVTATLIDNTLPNPSQAALLLATSAGHSSVSLALSIQDDESLNPLQNPNDRFDVDANQLLDVQDAITLIRYLRRSRTGATAPPIQGPPYLDTNGDHTIDMNDAIEVIREIRRRKSPGGGEGEADLSPVMAEGPTTPAADEDLIALIALHTAERRSRRAGP